MQKTSKCVYNLYHHFCWLMLFTVSNVMDCCKMCAEWYSNETVEKNPQILYCLKFFWSLKNQHRVVNASRDGANFTENAINNNNDNFKKNIHSYWLLNRLDHRKKWWEPNEYLRRSSDISSHETSFQGIIFNLSSFALSSSTEHSWGASFPRFWNLNVIIRKLVVLTHRRRYHESYLFKGENSRSCQQ